MALTDAQWAGLKSSRSDSWETPQEFFDELDAEFHFELDVCATPDNAKCRDWLAPPMEWMSPSMGALDVSWHLRAQVCYMNPPYGRQIGKWVAKAYEESQKGCTVVCLLPARTDTRWFHDYCIKGEIRFLRGRLKFGGCTENAPFPNMIVVFRGGA